MAKYILKRILVAIPLLFAMSLLTFFLMQMTPGNFFDSLKLNPQISPETIARYEKLYHLDKPWLEQYFYWLGNLLRFELGYSFFYNVPVAELISGRLWNTFILSLASLLFTWSVALPLGIWAAVRRNQWVDRVLSLGSFIGLSIPSFFLAILLLYAVSQWGILPLGGMRSAGYDDLSWFGKIMDLLRHLAIPTLVISVGSIAALQRIMRGNMLEVLRQQYILTARAKGLPEHRVIYRHALRNAVNPLITLFGYELSGLLGGAALTEIICSWPGLGSMMLTAVRAKDVYLVMTSMLMGGILLLLGNLLADILLACSDPRIRYDE
ncbi:MAG: ABC transporter substrate-binding protein [Omnitrophica WOR_2 bacterium RIFCSPHIGHO2_01_FULL_48_9]|nr:MAG: ABC transporter substrate-binding protein [Omnitrophica WOR_2 bacterium RIFCSPHIGHO2_02_FULL_48_11]OGX33265.1 MAG: ABC transporter substrate-binding protein [Omnitrophica WOR_2 bacterium RIFCSPHIGHO2_01_FULL_48_9]